MSDLSEALQKRLREFEKAVRDHEFMGAEPKEMWDEREAAFDKAKKRLIKKLWVLEGCSSFMNNMLKHKKKQPSLTQQEARALAEKLGIQL